jgi:U6 snRNA-associated Sm-like protein LSm8
VAQCLFMCSCVCVGPTLQGVLRGFDQHTNVVLEQAHERIYSETEGVEQEPLGLYVIRGDNIAVVGELDEDADLATDMSKVKCQPLQPIVHTSM